MEQKSPNASSPNSSDVTKPSPSGNDYSLSPSGLATMENLSLSRDSSKTNGAINGGLTPPPPPEAVSNPPPSAASTSGQAVGTKSALETIGVGVGSVSVEQAQQATKDEIGSKTTVADVGGAAAAAAEAAEEEEEEEGEDSSSESLSEDSEATWIEWFCGLRGNEFFVQVDEDYIQDDFNLTGLNSLVPYYDYALDMILDVEVSLDEALTEGQQEVVESAAEMLYGLIHARYIITSRGQSRAAQKYQHCDFGTCPRVFCHAQSVLPVGLSDLPRNYTVNVFCPRCGDIFYPRSTRQGNIDGAYFGTTFPHLFLMTHPNAIPAGKTSTYDPRVFGFRVNEESPYFKIKREGEKGEESRVGSSGNDKKKKGKGGVKGDVSERK